jgi:hypothetical protein
MKIKQLALAAAQVAEAQGTAAVTSSAIAQSIGINRVSVSRSALLPDIIAESKAIIASEKMTYPRAAIEYGIGELTHHQRQRVLRALVLETQGHTPTTCQQCRGV